MKYITAILILLCFAAQSQTKNLINPPTGNKNSIMYFTDALGADSAFALPDKCGTPDTSYFHKYSVKYRHSYIVTDTCAGTVYLFNPNTDLITALGSGGGSSYQLPYNGNSTDYLGGDTLYHSLASGTSGGDTTIFNPVIDSTGQSAYRVLYGRGNNHIGSDPLFLYDSIHNKLVINAANFSIGGNNTKLYVNGNSTIGGNLTNNGNTTIRGTATISTTATGAAGTDSVLVQNNGLVKKIGGNSYISPSDTATMLSTYLRTNIAAATYRTQAQVRTDISLTTTGTSGAATYNNSTGVLNVPQYSGGGGSSVVFDSLTWISAKNYNILPTNSEATNTTNATTALNFLIARGGGTLYFPYADSAYKVRLIIPDVSNFNNWLHIRIFGATPPAMIFGTLGTVTFPTKGVILKSSDTTSGNAVIQVRGDGANTFSALSLYIENLDIRTYNRPKIIGVKADSAAQLIMRNCSVNTNTYTNQCAQPVAGSKGISTPLISNGAIVYLNNILINGYHMGIDVNEHTVGQNINIFGCDTALNINSSYATIHFDAIDFARNRWNIVGTRASLLKAPLSFSNMDVEHVDSAAQTVDSTKWQVTQADIYDPSNYLRGCAFWSTTAAISGTHGIFTKTGGDSLNTYQLNGNGTAFFLRNLPNVITSTNTFSGANVFSATNTFSANQRILANLYVNKIGVGDSAYSNELSVVAAAAANHTLLNFKSTTASGKTQMDILNDNSVGGHISTYGTTNATSGLPNNFGVGADSTLIVYSGGTGGMTFNTNAGSSTNSMSIAKGTPGAVKIATYKMPITSGSNLQILQSNGTDASWVNTQWTTSGSNLNYTAGNVSIGSTSSVSPLYIESAGGAASGITLKATSSSQYSSLDFKDNAGVLNGQFLATNSGFSSGIFTGNFVGLANYATSGAVGLVSGGSSGIIKFATGGITTGNERARITSGGNMLIGTTTDNSTLTVNGSIAHGYIAKTTNIGVDGTNQTVNFTSGTDTLTLPTAVGITGRIYTAVNSGSGTCKILTTSSQTFVNINTAPTILTLNPVGAAAITSYTVMSNGANWIVIGKVKDE